MELKLIEVNIMKYNQRDCSRKSFHFPQTCLVFELFENYCDWFVEFLSFALERKCFCHFHCGTTLWCSSCMCRMVRVSFGCSAHPYLLIIAILRQFEGEKRIFCNTKPPQHQTMQMLLIGLRILPPFEHLLPSTVDSRLRLQTQFGLSVRVHWKTLCQQI